MNSAIHVFKFGGASVKDAKAVLNVVELIQKHDQSNLVVVVSAMGKTTNKLEDIFNSFINKDKEAYLKSTKELKTFHTNIIQDLFEGDSLEQINEIINALFHKISSFYEHHENENQSYLYDQLIPYGEMLSSKIIQHCLEKSGVKSSWLDARKCIKTDSNYQNANVDWNLTEKEINERLNQLYSIGRVVVSQGFVGSNSNEDSTTLGREGSDYSAGIFAYASDAKEVIIWKDVPGMLNADPKYFEDTIKLEQISFKEAIELSYYGASVIHPKTIKPLQNKNIPLYVKSFIHPEQKGTIIQKRTENDDAIPSFIFKKNQVLFSIMPKDFSFLIEENLSDIFLKLSRINAHINIMQNSALSFSFLMDDKMEIVSQVKAALESSFIVKYNTDLELVTIRHYDQQTIDFVTRGKEILLEQKTRSTARFVLGQEDTATNTFKEV
jgi:aspartate kinase